MDFEELHFLCKDIVLPADGAVAGTKGATSGADSSAAMFQGTILLALPLAVAAWSDDYFTELVSDLYNEARSAHRVPLVYHNEHLSRKAARWAEYLSIVPGSSCLRHADDGGQNIYFYWSHDPISEEKLALKCIDAFYKEIDLYNYRAPGYYHPAAHFTEMVWKSVTEIGVGVHRRLYRNRHAGCGVGGSPRRPAIGYMVVIQHNPPGNRDSRRQFLANVLRPVRHVRFL